MFIPRSWYERGVDYAPRVIGLAARTPWPPLRAVLVAELGAVLEAGRRRELELASAMPSAAPERAVEEGSLHEHALEEEEGSILDAEHLESWGGPAESAEAAEAEVLAEVETGGEAAGWVEAISEAIDAVDLDDLEGAAVLAPPKPPPLAPQGPPPLRRGLPTTEPSPDAGPDVPFLEEARRVAGGKTRPDEAAEPRKGR